MLYKIENVELLPTAMSVISRVKWYPWKVDVLMLLYRPLILKGSIIYNLIWLGIISALAKGQKKVFCGQ